LQYKVPYSHSEKQSSTETHEEPVQNATKLWLLGKKHKIVVVQRVCVRNLALKSSTQIEDMLGCVVGLVLLVYYATFVTKIMKKIKQRQRPF